MGRSQTINIIWVHGWGSNAKVWDRLSVNLPSQNHHFPTFRSAKTYGEFIAAITRLLRKRKTILIGWSMGGVFAMETALRFPDQVAGIIGINTTLCFTHDDASLGWPARVVKKMKKNLENDSYGVLSKFTESMFSNDDVAHGLDAEYYQEILTDEPGAGCDFTTVGLEAGLDYLVKTDLRREIDKLKCPMLWIHGEHDIICPFKGFLALKAGLAKYSHHRFTIFPKTGHASFFRYPRETVEVIKDFIREASY